MYKSRGFTLIEMLIAMLLLFMAASCLIGGLVCVSGRATGPTVRENAEAQAREYISTMHPSWRNTRRTCQAIDNDHNGYVRCSIMGDVTENGQSREVTEQIECSAYFAIDNNRGCQTPRGIVNVNNSGNVSN